MAVAPFFRSPSAKPEGTMGTKRYEHQRRALQMPASPPPGYARKVLVLNRTLEVDECRDVRSFSKRIGRLLRPGDSLLLHADAIQEHELSHEKDGLPRC